VLAKYSAENLRVRPRIGPDERGVVSRVTADDARWSDLNVELRRLGPGDRWQHETGDAEMALVVLGGRCAVSSSRGDFPRIGRRPDVWSGMPYALYLPRRTSFTLEGESDRVEVAAAWARTDQDHRARLVTPSDVRVEIRGGRSNTRQINSILPPGFDCDRLVCVEVYTPAGNWSSYPPHKHDEHRTDNQGVLAEADLEEIYLYKMRQPGGHALQRIYTGDRSLDAAIVAEDSDIVLVPYGYHPVSAAYGYDCYYLNFLAGSAQSLACTDDPAHAWVKETWTDTDPRVPMVTHEMET